MAVRSGYLYRRPSGIYVVRICIPARLRDAVGRSEIHVSTGLRELAPAQVLAFQTLADWKARLLKLDRMDVLKLDVGSPLLGGEGFLSLEAAADAIGLSAPRLAEEAANLGEDLHVYADGWPCVVVDDIRKLTPDGTDGTYCYDEARAIGIETALRKHVVLPDRRGAAAQIGRTGHVCEGLFFLDSRRRKAALTSNPDTTVPAAQVSIHKDAAERIRAALRAHLTPQAVEAAKEAASRTIAAPQGHKHASMKVSELVSAFVKAKVDGGRWKLNQQSKMETVTDSFVSLMNDPALGKIDRPLIERYREQLRRLPADIYQFRRKHGANLTLRQVADLAESLGLSARTQTSVDRAVGNLSEMLTWAVESGYMPENPAKAMAAKRSKAAQAKNQRDAFSPDDLTRVFDAEWFKTGRGELTKSGTYRTFCPHYYWLPLLGLYTGARINELSQLYLDDVRKTAAGAWYLDFNLDGADKLDADAPEDKSLKTDDSMRSVPLHSDVLRLGFEIYVQALRDAGHTRLFPELLHDKVKGYGKPTSQWFTRYMKARGIKRNGRKVFHSFRHTFISALFAEEVPEPIVNQFTGHARGQTMSSTRYRKDHAPDKLKPYIERLSFEGLPDIAPFDVAAGLDAVKDALDRKKSASGAL